MCEVHLNRQGNIYDLENNNAYDHSISFKLIGSEKILYDTQNHKSEIYICAFILSSLSTLQVEWAKMAELDIDHLHSFFL